MRQNRNRKGIILLVMVLLLGLIPMDLVKAEEVTNKYKGDGTDSPLVFYEIYGGGGDRGSLFKYDFIVLKNRSEESLNLDNWSVKYYIRSGHERINYGVELEGVLKPDSYYLIQGASSSNIGLDLPREADKINSSLRIAQKDFSLILMYNDFPADTVGFGQAVINSFKPALGGTAKLSSIRESNTGNNEKDFRNKLITKSDSLDYLIEPEDDMGTLLLVTIEEAREASGEIRTQGIITYINIKENQVIIEDESGGIILRGRDEIETVIDLELNLGDKIIVSGVVEGLEGLKYLNNLQNIEKLSGDNELPNKEVTISQILENPEAFESRRLFIKNVRLGPIDGEGKAPIYFEEETLNIYNVSELEDISEGDLINVTGVFQPKGSGSLLLVLKDDIQLIEKKKEVNSGTTQPGLPEQEEEKLEPSLPDLSEIEEKEDKNLLADNNMDGLRRPFEEKLSTKYLDLIINNYFESGVITKVDSFTQGKSEPVFWVNPFSDVSISDWFYEDVMHVSEKAWMKGIDASTFSPYENVNRAMFVVILYRMAGSPNVTESESFFDVPADAYYKDAISWAKSNNIVKGREKGKFQPNSALTREELITLQYRMAQYMAMEVAGTGSQFNDTDEISDWAKEAMDWAISKDIIKGMGDGNLNPKGNTNRGQVAAIISRFDKMQ